ncbi:sigma-54 interaction domain-containing protein [Thiorhodococcus minor]|uniref:Sigma-54-dependent Fis family transcriptional regulator n=1 Tax=Thiorhodococcus minor TaxID=57489 RepID=A0A6M0JXU2_9GAMM|nr:sigma-54 dependent transcriptional regulator [Thiorhodococcus minor]NEV62342.1 sigma-54-dependent Fis family transcriptional regulator [Thiorhodococcus minor]
MRILVSWVGQTDLKAAAGVEAVGLGPIGQAVTERAFERVVLLCNYPKADSAGFLPWIERQTTATVELTLVSLSRPTHFGEIYQAVTETLARLLQRFGDATRLTFHLSPGTPAMAAVWILVSKTRYGAELIESSPQEGVRTAEVPFDISAEFIPEVYRQADRELVRVGSGLAEMAPEFSDIVHQGPTMRRVIERARRVAARTVPVLIEGESGTGKELLARAIHRSSPRRDRPFVAVNCGAVSRELAESEFFGHRKGAFTGATSERIGYFEAADGGTLFLDEIGELPLDLQVKLLRVLQEGQVTRVGTTQPRTIDVRLIAATNRALATEVVAGRFRSDLFFRIAVALIQVPSISERPGDLTPLVEHLLTQINRDGATDPGWQTKRLAPTALNRLARHAWPGNVRELSNTLARAALWSKGDTVSERDIEEALLELPPPKAEDDGLLGHPVEQGVDLPDLMRQLASHYLAAAMQVTGGNKTRAAELLGLSSYMTLTNWLKKYGATPET